MVHTLSHRWPLGTPDASAWQVAPFPRAVQDSRLRQSPAVRAPVLERLKSERWRGALPPFVCAASRGLGTPADLFQRVIASLTRSRCRSAHEKLDIEGPATRWSQSLTEGLVLRAFTIWRAA